MKLLFFVKVYFDYGWNTFDFVIVVLLLILTILAGFLPMDAGPQQALLATVRGAKLLCLFNKAPILHKLFQTLILALPAIVNLAVLFLIMMCLFALMGIYLFATTKLQVDLEPRANFQTFLTAFMTIFRISTYDGWNQVLHDAMRQRTQYFDCTDYPTYDEIQRNRGEPNGCGLAYAPAYFLPLMFFIIFVFLNLFVAIVVSSMLDISKLSESVLSDDKLESFQNAWKKQDPDVSGCRDNG